MLILQYKVSVLIIEFVASSLIEVVAFVLFMFMLVLLSFCIAIVSRRIKIYIIINSRQR